MKRQTPHGPEFSRSSLLAALIGRCIVAVVIFCTLGSACAADFTIASAISMKTALEQAKPELERVAGEKITFDFGASGTLAAQIRQGMPVDLFISADRPTMNGLVDAKLFDVKTVMLLAGNQLVLVTPRNPRAGVHIQGFSDLLSKSVQHVAIGEPKTVPAGAYAVQALRYLKLYEPLERKGLLIDGENVAQVLAYVARGDVDAGLVYRTDALVSRDVQVVAAASEESHDPIVYVMGIVSGSPNAVVAGRVEHTLLQEKVQKILMGLGFTSATKPTTNPAK